jgi:hypothetical protein
MANAVINQIIPGTVQYFTTPTVDLTAVAITNFAMPLASGLKFHTVAARMEIMTRDATITTQISMQFTQNSSALNAVQATGNPSALAAPESLSLSSALLIAPDMTTFPIQASITIGGAGAGLTTYTGFFVLAGYYL